MSSRGLFLSPMTLNDLIPLSLALGWNAPSLQRSPGSTKSLKDWKWSPCNPPSSKYRAYHFIQQFLLTVHKLMIELEVILLPLFSHGIPRLDLDTPNGVHFTTAYTIQEWIFTAVRGLFQSMSFVSSPASDNWGKHWWGHSTDCVTIIQKWDFQVLWSCK